MSPEEIIEALEHDVLLPNPPDRDEWDRTALNITALITEYRFIDEQEQVTFGLMLRWRERALELGWPGEREA